MAEAQHITQRQKGAQGLQWPIGQPLTFYSVEGTDSGGRVRFVRDFHRAMELATPRPAQLRRNVDRGRVGVRRGTRLVRVRAGRRKGAAGDGQTATQVGVIR